MYIRQTRNDSRDSFIIAQIMRFGQFSATALSEEVIVAMRQLSRYRLALVDSCGDCKRRVIALLDQVFPEYDSLFSDTFGVASREILILSEYYRSLRARGKHHLTAIGTVSHKLCNMIYTIRKEDSPWQPVPPKDRKVSNNTEERR